LDIPDHALLFVMFIRAKSYAAQRHHATTPHNHTGQPHSPDNYMCLSSGAPSPRHHWQYARRSGLNVAPMHQNQHHQSRSIGHDMALASLDLLAGIIA
jgi:hypothetical protein